MAEIVHLVTGIKESEAAAMSRPHPHHLKSPVIKEAICSEFSHLNFTNDVTGLLSESLRSDETFNDLKALHRGSEVAIRKARKSWMWDDEVRLPILSLLLTASLRHHIAD